MNYLKVIILFLSTFVYFLRTLIRPDLVLDLKQKWAQFLIAQFGYTIHVTGDAPLNGPLILVGNHISFLDILVLMAVHPKITFVAKKEIRRWPIVGISAYRVGTLFVDRSPQADRKKTRHEIAQQLEKNKAMLVIFPSGTTTLDEAKLWKKGAFEIAQDSNIPVQLFKLSYKPLRESAYIDDDNIMTQMSHMLDIKNKTVHLQWLEKRFVDHPQENADQMRKKILELNQ